MSEILTPDAVAELAALCEREHDAALAMDLLYDNSLELRRDHDGACIQWSCWHCGDRIGPRSDTPVGAVIEMFPDAFGEAVMPSVLASHEALRSERDAMRGLLAYWFEHRRGHDDDAPCVICYDTRAALEVKP